jgi:hypothetical protein
MDRLADSAPIPLFANYIAEAQECTVRRVMMESADPIITMARLTKLTALTHSQVAAVMRSMLARKTAVIVAGADKRHSYVLAERHILPTIKERATWYRSELKNYAANMRRFAAACEASR